MIKFRKLHLIVVLILLTIGISITSAQSSQNLLTNPGFEGNFVTLNGDQQRQVGQGWTPWHVPPTSEMPSFQNATPNYQPAAPNSARIRSGNNAQMYFSFFETHDGGVYQQVSGVTDGAEYRFSIYAYVWSSTFEDLDISEDPGDVAVRVGIDPTGGTDGTSSDIIWSTPAIFYDAYRQYSVIATADSSTITVFVESTVGIAVQNSYIYLDDAVLEGTSASPAQPTSTSQPTATTDSSGGIGQSTPTPEVVSSISTSTPTPTQQTNTVPTATPVSSGDIGKPISDTFPGTIVHTVRRGDTVSRIAILYDSTIQAIIEANGLNESALIFVGQGLLVPVRIPDPATETPTFTPVVVVATATPGVAPIPSGGTYTVVPGDTLNRIAARFNTTVGALVQLNGIANPNRIFSGQVLRIPVGTGTQNPTTPPQTVPTPTPQPVAQTYTVVPGDTLFRLALRFGVNIVDLANANNITNYNRIFIGQVLTIPR